ncbi:uncharacterized protein LOC122831395 [Tachysurus ichikawai]
MDRFKLPSPLVLTGNISENWRRWEQRFQIYMTASGAAEKEAKVQLKPEGTISLECSNAQTKSNLLFYVSNHSEAAILGKDACGALGLIKRMDIDTLAVKYSTTNDELLKQHASVFEGLGEFSGEHHIHIDPTVTPVIHGCRKVLLAVMDSLRDTLDDLLKADSLVIIEKKDKKKLRVCLDPTDLNKAILRQHYSIPTADEVLCKLAAVCKFCNATLTETAGITSNFYRHLERKHKERFLEYKAGQQTDVTQSTIALSFTQKVQVYSLHSTRQQAISKAIIQDLIIGCCLPLSLVENGHFKHFLEIMDNKYTPISRRTISEKQIPVLVKTVKETVLKKLETQSSVSLTTDLWSDRRLRSFLGVTAHVCNKLKDSDSYALESYLLDCRHFTGRHTVVGSELLLPLRRSQRNMVYVRR